MQPNIKIQKTYSITTDQKFHTQVEKLKINFLSRGYNDKLPDKANAHAQQFTQQQLVQTVREINQPHLHLQFYTILT